ncbi:MAG: TldD/PmbA family protein [Clostridia bacterium]|nr:TldD/PmbA family protein [Clostridia bacterium]
MFEQTKRILKEIGCDTYELTEVKKNVWEFYFIRHKLDQNRVVETRELEATLYRPMEDGKLLGSASGPISPTADEAEIKKALETLYYQASFVKNPAYTLTDKPVPAIESKPVDVAAIAKDFIEAMQAVPETETERINSYEIFVREITKTFENSNGVTSVVTYPSSMIEVVVNAAKGDHEIEIYRNFTSGVCDREKLTRDVAAAMRFGTDRLSAEPTPKLGTADVIFSTDDAAEIYDYFAERMNAQLQFMQLSDWTPGKPVADYTTGDRVSLLATPTLENSSRSFPVDGEGALIRERYLVRDGVAENVWGNRKTSQYLGAEDSSIVYNFVVSGGRESADALHDGDYLELVEFSDFQVDSIGGDIMGEIRLGYWHHDGKVEVITGGSVSGRMQDVIPSMRFSAETEQYDNYVIPKETRLYGLTITGVR